MKNIIKSCVALLLAVCMVIGFIPATVFANTEDGSAEAANYDSFDVDGDGTINYVSFGDSVTNGYGMEEYRYPDGTNVYGFGMEATGSYPVMVRDLLTENTSENVEVDLHQLAISGFRIDELDWMLNDDYVPDSYNLYQYHSERSNWCKFVADNKWNADADFRAKYPNYDPKTSTLAQANALIQQEYRAAVYGADLITINLGTNNFGTFLTQQLQKALGLADNDFVVDFRQYADEETAAALDEIVQGMVMGMLGTNDADSQIVQITELMARCMMYGYIGFTQHYDAVIEKIYEMNPNVQIVVIDCYSMLNGVQMEGEALGDALDLDDMYAMFIDLANNYAREQSPYASKVAHATLASEPGLFVDYYKEYNYPDHQVMHPSAERLLNEFVIEMTIGWVDHLPNREKFYGKYDADGNLIQEGQLHSIQLMDSYVYNLPATVKEHVIDTVNGMIVENLAPVEALVRDAIPSVVAANGILDMLIQNMFNDTYLPIFVLSLGEDAAADSMRNILFGEIEKYIADDLLGRMYPDLKFDGSEEDNAAIAEKRTALATVAYEMAKVYFSYDNHYVDVNITAGTATQDPTKEAAAHDAAVVYGMQFMITAMGKAESDAEAQAMAQQAVGLYKVYVANGGNVTANEDGSLTLTEDAVAAALVAAVSTEYDEATATALCAIYSDVKNAEVENYTPVATEDQMRAVYVKFLSESGMFGNMDAEGKPTAVTEEVLSLVNSVVNCYLNEELNGQFLHDDVVATMKFFLTFMKMDPSLYDAYLSYKRVAITISKIAKCDAIYFDKILEAAQSGNILGGMTEKFANGTLKLDKPDPKTYAGGAEDPAYLSDMDEYMSDSALAVLYFRYMCLTGIFTHPSEAGQEVMFAAVVEALNNMPVSEGEDSGIRGKKILVLGDNIAAAENNSYVDQLKAKLANADITNLSKTGFRLNELCALLDVNYAGDAYTKDMLGTEEEQAALSKEYEDAIKANDTIVLNMGAMNMAFIATQMDKYLNDNKSAYRMSFANVKNMQTVVEFGETEEENKTLGENCDEFLANFENVFTSDGADATTMQTGVMMLAFKTYCYGYDTFVDCLDETINAIKSMNPNADIVLVGQYDLLNDTYAATEDMHLELGAFINYALELMNDYMKNYADMTKNVTYVDVSGTTNTAGGENMLSGGNMANAFVEALPDANGAAYIAEQIATTITNAVEVGYTVAGKITSYLSDTADITVELKNADGETVSTTVKGNSAEYSFSGVASGTYSMVISKANHATRTYEVVVADSDKTVDAQLWLLGDVTCDGQITASDYSRLLAHVKKTNLITDAAILLAADVTGDGQVTASDYSRLLAHVKKTNPLW